MTLYGYWRSTTAYRVRIALNLKGLSYEVKPIDLLGGAQGNEDYLALNPIAGVPTLVLDNGTVLTQSMAILEYLEASQPDPALLPHDKLLAAQVRAAAMVIASDIHPLNNLKVNKALKQRGFTDVEVVEWMIDWMDRGFFAYDMLVASDTAFSFTEAPTFADLCLVPQLYNAHRWGMDLSRFPRLTEIETRCLELPAFAQAHPNAQPDAL